MPLVMHAVNGFWKKSLKRRGEHLCWSALNQARSPLFYIKGEVPDTLEGRFDCASLHLILLLRHLKGALAQSVFDAFFSYTDLTLRELGVSDLKVGKQVKKCAKFFYGARKAYDDALEGRGSLEGALIRNLYGGNSSTYIKEIAAYVRACDAFLKQVSLEEESPLKWPQLEEREKKL